MMETIMMQRFPKMTPRKIPRRELRPALVQLSCLPSRSTGMPDTWSPVPWDTATPIQDGGRQKNTRPVKCPRFEAIYDLEKRFNETHGTKCNFWKTPLKNGKSPVPCQRKGDTASSQEAIELYRPTFNERLEKIVQNTAIVLPPILPQSETSKRSLRPINEAGTLQEKNYIFDQSTKTGPRARFLRDEIHLPDVYPQCYECRECKRQYTSDMFVQKWKGRNSVSPQCTVPSRQSKKPETGDKQRQNCDVLGERYCKACIEKRNKHFSLKMEGHALTPGKLHATHYASEPY